MGFGTIRNNTALKLNRRGHPHVAGFGTDVMAIEKVLNVTPDKAKEIKAEISGNAIGEASNNRSDEDVEIYGN